MKYAITDLTSEELAKCMSALGNAAPAAAPPAPPATGPAPTVSVGGPPPSAPPTSAPAAPSAPAPAAPAAPAPPAPPAPAAAAPASTLHTETLNAMQAYGKSPHKAAGIKRILAKVGMTKIEPTTPPETLTWLKSVFSQQADGSFFTPEYVESL